jgi:hypothetical protein
LSKDFSSKKHSLESVLKKDKEKDLSESDKNFAESSVDCFTILTESSSFSVTNSAESSADSSKNFVELIAQSSFQQLIERKSKVFKDHRSSHFIIFFSFSEVEMTSQHSKRIDQNMQEMIQIVIREMMSEIVQQSVTATMNVTATTTRSDSSSVTNHSQMISRTTSNSRFDR